MNLLKKSDDEIIKIANPIWLNLVKSSNIKDYGGFTKDFSSQMLYGANEVELGKQWASNKLLTSLSEQQEVLGCIRRDNFITVLYKQKSDTKEKQIINPRTGCATTHRTENAGDSANQGNVEQIRSYDVSK